MSLADVLNFAVYLMFAATVFSVFTVQALLISSSTDRLSGSEVGYLLFGVTGLCSIFLWLVASIPGLGVFSLGWFTQKMLAFTVALVASLSAWEYLGKDRSYVPRWSWLGDSVTGFVLWFGVCCIVVSVLLESLVAATPVVGGFFAGMLSTLVIVFAGKVIHRILVYTPDGTSDGGSVVFESSDGMIYDQDSEV